MDTEVISETLNESMEELLRNAEGHYLSKAVWNNKNVKYNRFPNIHLTYVVVMLLLAATTLISKSSWIGFLFALSVLLYLMAIVSIFLFLVMRSPIDIFRVTRISFIKEKINNYHSLLENAISVEVNRHSVEEINAWVQTRKPLYKGINDSFKVIFAPFAILSLYTIYKIITDTLGIKFLDSQYWVANFADRGLDLIGFSILFAAIVLITLLVQLAILRLTLRSAILEYLEGLLKSRK